MPINKPRPGQFGLTKIHGAAGLGIVVGQELLRLRYPECPVQHAFLVLDDETVIEAEPGGAIITPLAFYTETFRVKETFYSDLILTDKQVEDVCNAGRKLKGIPYNFPTYGVLALNRFGIHTPHLDHMISNKGFMMCSQLVDESEHRGGVQLYADGRLPQNVIPADLWKDFILDKKSWPVR